MGASGSKNARPDETSTAVTTTAAASDDARSPSIKDEVLGMVLDGIFLYGMYVSAKYLYKVRSCVYGVVAVVCICALVSKDSGKLMPCFAVPRTSSQ